MFFCVRTGVFNSYFLAHKKLLNTLFASKNSGPGKPGLFYQGNMPICS